MKIMKTKTIQLKKSILTRLKKIKKILSMIIVMRAILVLKAWIFVAQCQDQDLAIQLVKVVKMLQKILAL
jgi:hypothetical protein